jgi:hypoxanthine phosphoribosyltransferase
MPDFDLVLSKEKIAESIKIIADTISADYKENPPVLIGALKGSFIFLSDLARAISIPVQIGFVGVSSYGSGTTSSGTIKVTKELDTDISGKPVIIVEDIVDSGLTLEFIVKYLNDYNPESIKVCTFINKTERRKVDVNVDYICNTIAEGFLIGYGLDYDEEYRNLPALYHLKL